MKESRIVVNRGRKSLISVVQPERALALRIKIETALQRERFGGENGERRIVPVVDGESKMDGIVTNVNVRGGYVSGDRVHG